MTSLATFLKQFPDDEACWRHLEPVRRPRGPVCPKCGNVGQTSTPGWAFYHRCKACAAVFTAASGTPLEGTHLPMRTWFAASYLLTVSSKALFGRFPASSRHRPENRLVSRPSRTGHDGGQERASSRHCRGGRNLYRVGRCKRGSASKRDDDNDQPNGRGGSRKAMVLTAVERKGRVRARRGGTRSATTMAPLSAAECIARISAMFGGSVARLAWKALTA